MHIGDIEIEWVKELAYKYYHDYHESPIPKSFDLSNAFYWEDTLEGIDFWRHILEYRKVNLSLLPSGYKIPKPKPIKINELLLLLKDLNN